jgi:signal transduction histidine kinase
MSGDAEGGPTPGPGVQDERRRRARLARVRQELLAPVSSVTGCADILRDEAGRLGLEGMTPDLDRILAAGGVLLELVERLSDLGAATDPQAGEGATAVQERLRHDLRNPLSAIKGYGEMLLEDLDDHGGGALRPDLDRLQAEVTGLLASLDAVVDLSDGGAGRVEGGAGPASAMVADLLEAIRPGGPDEAGPRETGRILVVDDSAGNRDLLARRLRSEGHRRSRRPRAARRCGSSRARARTSTWSCST